MAKDMPDFSRLPVTIRRRKLGKRQTIEIHRDFVKVTEKGLFATNWEEPVAAFEGVLRRRDREPRRGGRYAPVHLVELVHPNTTKTLRLYKAEKKEGIHKLWEDAARALDLPALSARTDDIVARAPEDLDKSLRQLTVEGKVSVDFDEGAPPPRGVTLEQAESERRIVLSILAWPYPFLVFWAVLTAPLVLAVPFGLFLLWWVGLTVNKLVFFAVSVLVVVGFGLYLLWMLFKRRIVITPREVRCSWWSPLGTITEALPLQELETVRRIGSELVMESDTASVSISNLGKPQLRWLEQFILAAIVASPR